MKKKGLITLMSGGLFFLLLAAMPPQATPAPPTNLPKVISMTTLPEGTAKYAQAAAFRAAVEKFTPMKLRLESSGTDLTRVGPMAIGEAEFAYITGGIAAGAAKGEAVFSQLGAFPIRRVWNGYPFVGAMYSRADAGFKTIVDLRGKRLPQSPGAYEWSLNNAGILAFGGLTIEDVKVVKVAGIGAALKGPLEGTLDATQGSLFSSAVVELAAGPHGVHWFDMPASDVEGWKRQKEVAPWANPIETTAAGLKKGETITGAGYENGIYSTAAVSGDIVYALCEAMYKGFDTYKKMSKGLLDWTWERAYSLDVMPEVPYHAGTVKFLKDMGVWSSAHEQLQKNALEEENKRLKK